MVPTKSTSFTPAPHVPCRMSALQGAGCAMARGGQLSQHATSYRFEPSRPKLLRAPGNVRNERLPPVRLRGTQADLGDLSELAPAPCKRISVRPFAWKRRMHDPNGDSALPQRLAR